MPENMPTNSLINIHDGEEYTRALRAAFQDTARVLQLHCGPYAQYSILPTLTVGNKMIDQYTKDGINIVASLKTATPLTSHVMRLMTYLGTRMDNACHDGTTTAMLLFATMADHLLAGLSAAAAAGVNMAQHRHLLKIELEKFITECEEVLEEDLLRVSDIAKIFNTTEDKAVWAVAYHQSMIASKGDKELSHGIATVLASLPVDLHGQFNLRTPNVESKERFTVTTHDFDFEIPGMVSNPAHYNSALRTQLDLPDALLLVTPNELIQGNPEVDYLVQFLSDNADTSPIQKPLVIIAPTINSPKLFDVIHLHNATYPNAKVIPMTMIVGQATQSFAEALLATAGAVPLHSVLHDNAMDAFIDGVAIKQIRQRITIKHLYKKTGARLHPSYTDPDRNPYYTKVLAELNTYIDNATKQHDPDRGTEVMLMHVINLVRYMTAQTLVDLSIGGTSHEHVANTSVAKDAFGAAVSALEDGVILGGHQRLLDYTVDAVEYHTATNQSASDYARSSVTSAFSQAFLNVLSVIYYSKSAPIWKTKNELLDIADVFVNFTSAADMDTRGFFLESVVPDKSGDLEVVPRDLAMIKGFLTGESTVSVVMQPIKGHQEFFKRARELLPKIINTASLVDPYHTTQRD